MTDPNTTNTITNIATHGGGIVVALFFIRRWMNKREKTEDEIRKEVAEKVEKAAQTLAESHKTSSEEIKTKIADNRAFYAQSYGDIKCSIDKLSDHVEATNGRVKETEIAVRDVKSRCDERSKAFYRAEDEERRKS